MSGGMIGRYLPKELVEAATTQALGFCLQSAKRPYFTIWYNKSISLIYHGFVYMSLDGFAALGTAICPKTCPKRDLCLSGKRT